MITKLKSNQIFVFGSNLAGNHAGGAAKQAHEQFGAEENIGRGLTGRCYAFPTLGYQFEKMTPSSLRHARDEFFSTARALPEKIFLMTAIGTGIANFNVEEMKSLFANPPKNVILPDEFL